MTGSSCIGVRRPGMTLSSLFSQEDKLIIRYYKMICISVLTKVEHHEVCKLVEQISDRIWVLHVAGTGKDM